MGLRQGAVTSVPPGLQAVSLHSPAHPFVRRPSCCPWQEPCVCLLLKATFFQPPPCVAVVSHSTVIHSILLITNFNVPRNHLEVLSESNSRFSRSGWGPRIYSNKLPDEADAAGPQTVYILDLRVSFPEFLTYNTQKVHFNSKKHLVFRARCCGSLAQPLSRSQMGDSGGQGVLGACIRAVTSVLRDSSHRLSPGQAARLA